MKSIDGVGLNEVTSVYSGPQGDLFALLMGQQLHVGGMNSSIDLAERAEIGAGLERNRNVENGQHRCREEGFDDRILLVLADACESGLPRGGADSSGARTHGAMSRTKRNSSAKLQDWFDQVA
jgi:hypothetical protein